jgi:hypothetical protein
MFDPPGAHFDNSTLLSDAEVEKVENVGEEDVKTEGTVR